MLSDSEQRAARLAISLYRADPERVQRTVRAVLRAKAQGQAASLIEALERENVLTQGQVQQLRDSLEQTQFDLELAGVSGSLASPVPEGLRVPAPSNRIPFEPETMGHYRILRRLGEGGMGSVFLAFDKNANRQVAIKILAPERAQIPSFLDRFHREGLNGALLNHPNIVRGYEADRDRQTGLNYLVLEYVDGSSAHELLERFGPLPVGVAVRVAVDVARALAHSHASGIIHRDIKPHNILITSSGIAKLSDLGLAKKLNDSSHLTSARQGVGTPYYVPYEQALNAKKADGRSDIYALGASLYHLLTGEVPFPGESTLEIVERQAAGKYIPARTANSAVPQALEDILARMMAFLPEDRYATAGETLEALEKSGLADPESEVAELVNICQSSAQPASASPLHQTSPDLRPEDRTPDGKTGPESNLWYLRFFDRHGNLAEAVLPLAEIARRLRAGVITAEKTRISRVPRVGFRPLRDVPEVRRALAEVLKEMGPAEAERVAAERPWRRPWVLWTAVAAAVALLAAVAAVALQLL